MELLKDDRLLPLAAKYASRLGRVHLADKLGNLAETWEKEADKLNVAQTSHFQELDTQETYDVTNTETQDLNASLIIPQKVKEKKVDADTSLRPVVSTLFYNNLNLIQSYYLSDLYCITCHLVLNKQTSIFTLFIEGI